MKALFLPGFQNLKRSTLPENPGNDNIRVEDGLDLHFAWRRTLDPHLGPGVLGHADFGDTLHQNAAAGVKMSPKAPLNDSDHLNPYFFERSPEI